MIVWLVDSVVFRGASWLLKCKTSGRQLSLSLFTDIKELLLNPHDFNTPILYTFGKFEFTYGTQQMHKCLCYD